MKAILLAGGKGTRLGALGHKTPKCLLPIGREPLLGRLLGQVRDVGISEVLVNTHHLAPMIHDYVAKSAFASMVTLDYEPRLLGTAGTLRHRWAFLGGVPGLVMHADNYFGDELPGLISSFQARPSATDMAMMLFPSRNPSSCGVVELDAEGIVTSFHEKVPHPPTNLANSAVYVMSPNISDVFGSLPASTPDISKHLVPLLNGRIYGHIAADEVIDIGTPGSLETACRKHNERRSHFGHK